MDSIQFSPFDSYYYRIKIGTLTISPQSLSPDQLDYLLTGAKKDDYQLVIMRVSRDDLQLVSRLETNGVKSYGTLVTSRIELPHILLLPQRAASVVVEYSDTIELKDDLQQIVDIGSTAFSSHLTADIRLPTDATRELYADWCKNDCKGRAQQIIMVKRADTIVGFATVIVRSELHAVGMIDLLAVASHERGKGIGRLLVQSCNAWLSKNTKTATVGTEADSSAYRLYKKCGFSPISYQYTYHVWIDSFI